MFWRKDPLPSPMYSTTSSRRSSADPGPLYPPSSFQSSFQPLHSTLAVDQYTYEERDRAEMLDADPDAELDVDADPAMDPDPSFRLRRVTTAHSAITEGLASDARQEERRKRRRLFGTLRRKGSKADKLCEGAPSSSRKSSWGRKHSATSVGEPKVERAGEDEIPLQVLALPREGPASTATLGGRSRFGSEAGTELHSGAGTSATTPLVQSDAGDASLKKKKSKKPGKPRTIYVNMPLPPDMLAKGEPIIRYVRNKVRTSKYTIVSFLPKNLYEQFRRVANIYFLGLVVLQVFPMFGASTPQIAMLPLVAVLVMTGLKDGLEDWRRARLDNEVNNSAATKLGSWKNVNQPTDPRNWFERTLGLGNDSTTPSKGVQKLRKAEAKAGMEVVQQRKAKEDEALEEQLASPHVGGEEDRSDTMGASELVEKVRRGSFGSNAPSMRSRRNADTVIDEHYRGSDTAKWERTLWKKLEVGDIVLLRENEQIPADIVVLATSDQDDVCFVETKNLDGETNLKIRKALRPTAGIHTEEDLARSRFVVECEAPHAHLYTHNGSLKYYPGGDGGYPGDTQRKEVVIPISINELLLRGCMLRNTAWVIGLVSFTGADTKIMLNGGETPSKRSKIEREMNFNVIVNLCILLILCLLSACIFGYFQSLDHTSATYFEIGAQTSSSTIVNAIIIFASSLVSFQNIVPISLYISMDIVKICQAFFISQDREMYYAPFDTACVPKSLIAEDLGEVAYIMSDKTGTITANQMSFIKCSIGGKAYGDALTEAMFSQAKREGRDLGFDFAQQSQVLAKSKETMLDTLRSIFTSRYLRPDKVTLISPELVSHMQNPSDPRRDAIIDFFRALAICQGVLARVDPDDEFVIDYKAESPDEEALVSAARDMGCVFLSRKPGALVIEVMGQRETWVPLQVLDFTSARKRMSVIARGPDGRIRLFTKGADSVIQQRLAEDQDPAIRASTQSDLEVFSNGGLRCLLVGSRFVSAEEYASWSKEYNTASSAIVNRDDEVDRACNLMEHSLHILGATALEDKLQDGVPDAIRVLREAGIKIWLLTGDKTTTAIEIAYSANLLDTNQEVLIISAESRENCRQQLEAGWQMIEEGRRNGTAQAFAVVIDGDSLRYALEKDLKALFLQVGVECATVICCRVSPSQKALTVRLVKEGCKAMCLAIGDGANDVAMIQEAHVGVGMFGLEGSQAAMSADFAFGQFRYLPRLLLVHGSLSYKRISDMIMSFFYKTLVWTLILFWYMIFNSFDGTYLYDYTFMLLYALLFTSLPVVVLGAFDQHLRPAALMAFPPLYKRGIKGMEYTRRRFAIYMVEAAWQSLVLFYVPYFCYGGGATWSSSGRDMNSLVLLGTTVAANAVIAATIGVLINYHIYNIFALIGAGLSILAVLLWIPIYSSFGVFNFAGAAGELYGSPLFWLTIPASLVIAAGPRLIIKMFRELYTPLDRDIIREAWHNGVHPEEEAAARPSEAESQEERIRTPPPDFTAFDRGTAAPPPRPARPDADDFGSQAQARQSSNLVALWHNSVADPNALLPPNASPSSRHPSPLIQYSAPATPDPTSAAGLLQPHGSPPPGYNEMTQTMSATNLLR